MNYNSFCYNNENCHKLKRNEKNNENNNGNL
jgi:hypothetical protein